MKWEEARDKLLEVAAGRFCQLRFGLTMKDGKPIETDCWLYIDRGCSSGMGTLTWEKAFEALDQVMNLKPKELEEEPVGVEDKVEVKKRNEY